MSQSSRQPNSQAAHRRESTLKRLRSLSHLLDNAIPIPGTSYRVGLDPIIGLFPGAGDYVGAALSAYIVLQAALLGADKKMLVRMVFNIVLETLIGTVPVLGDLFDATWKANAKNMAMLESHLNFPQASQKVDWWFIVLLLAVLMLVVVAVTAIGVIILRLLLQAVSS